MCIKKEDYDKLVEALGDVKKDVGKVKHDTGNIRQTQTALGNSVRDIEDHLRRLNSRTRTVEHKVENLEDPIRQGAYCVQKDVIDTIQSSMLTIERFEEWQATQKRQEEGDQARKMQAELIAVQAFDAKQTKMQWIVAAITGVGMAIVSLITFFA